jgi:hypothetical protein
MNATNMTSRCSHREKMRRNPLSRRNSRSISLRRVYRARAYSHGASRLCLGGTTGPYPTFHGQLPRRIAFIRPIHSQVDRARHSPDAVPPLPPLGRIVGLARGQGNCDGRSRLRGHQMNRGRPSAAGPATGVRAVFCNAPVPSGWTLTLVRSKATASIFTRRI